MYKSAKIVGVLPDPLYTVEPCVPTHPPIHPPLPKTCSPRVEHPLQCYASPHGEMWGGGGGGGGALGALEPLQCKEEGLSFLVGIGIVAITQSNYSHKH